MQFKVLALAVALAGSASAQFENIPPSILGVLATAVPADLASEFAQNPSSVFQEVKSSVDAGQPPTWYTALPTDVQSALNSIAGGAASTGATPTGSASATGSDAVSSIQNSVSSVINSISSEINSAASSIASGGSSATSGTGSESPSDSATDSAASATASSTGGAAIPTGVIGAGVAGIIGLAGILAL